MSAPVSPALRPGRERDATKPDSNPPLGASTGVAGDTVAPDRIKHPTALGANPLPATPLGRRRPTTVADSVAAVLRLDWQTGDDGAELTREARCLCGEAFAQRQLSTRYLALRSPGQLAALARECPGYWVPLNCPPCEHMQLAADARRDDAEAERETASARRRGITSDDERYEKAEREAMSAP